MKYILEQQVVLTQRTTYETSYNPTLSSDSDFIRAILNGNAEPIDTISLEESATPVKNTQTISKKDDYGNNTEIFNNEIGTRAANVGSSDYHTHGNYQPWDIWREYHLDPWDADIIKRTLRKKDIPNMTPEESRIEDYEKIIQDCQEKIRLIKAGYKW